MKSLKLLLAAFVAAGSLQVAAAQEYKEAFNAAIAAAEAKKYTEAYTQYEASLAGARAENDSEVIDSATRTQSRIAKILGTSAYKAGNYAKALEWFDNGIAKDGDYAQNHYMKGLTLKQQGNEDEAMTALVFATKSSDRKTARAADKAIRGHYHNVASEIVAQSTVSRSGADQAIAALTKMQTYVEADANTFYYMGLAHQAKGEYTQAASYADQAIAVHRGGRSDKAKLYFLKGEAMMNAGNNGAAKEAFAQAVYGSYKASAEHYLQTL